MLWVLCKPSVQCAAVTPHDTFKASHMDCNIFPIYSIPIYFTVFFFLVLFF